MAYLYAISDNAVLRRAAGSLQIENAMPDGWKPYPSTESDNPIQSWLEGTPLTPEDARKKLEDFRLTSCEIGE